MWVQVPPPAQQMTQERLSPKMDFFIEQENNVNCGPTCIQMLLLEANIDLKQSLLAKMLNTNEEGTDYENILSFIKRFFSEFVVVDFASLSDLKAQGREKRILTSIIYDSEEDKNGKTEKISHYTLVDLVKDKETADETIYLRDPSAGIYPLTEEEFLNTWEKWIIAINLSSLNKDLLKKYEESWPNEEKQNN